jgi:hypothetical protein
MPALKTALSSPSEATARMPVRARRNPLVPGSHKAYYHDWFFNS